MVKISLAKYESECKSPCTLYIVLFSVFFTVNTGIDTFFAFFFIGTQKMKSLLVLIIALRQSFIKHINGKYYRNKH